MRTVRLRHVLNVISIAIPISRMTWNPSWAQRKLRSVAILREAIHETMESGSVPLKYVYPVNETRNAACKIVIGPPYR